MPPRAVKRREPTKAQLTAILERREAQNAARQAHWLEAVGHDGGLWSWASSPHVLWLATVLAGG
jgi:hypothetical protein